MNCSLRSPASAALRYTEDRHEGRCVDGEAPNCVVREKVRHPVGEAPRPMFGLLLVCDPGHSVDRDDGRRVGVVDVPIAPANAPVPPTIVILPTNLFMWPTVNRGVFDSCT